jgi:hypothetical protein
MERDFRQGADMPMSWRHTGRLKRFIKPEFTQIVQHESSKTFSVDVHPFLERECHNCQHVSLGYRFVMKCCYCRQDLLLQFCPTSRHQKFPNKWDKTLSANFAAITVTFPCKLPTVHFTSQHIAIAYDDSDILPSHWKNGKESKGCHRTKSWHKIMKLIQHCRRARFQNDQNECQIINCPNYERSLLRKWGFTLVTICSNCHHGGIKEMSDSVEI